MQETDVTYRGNTLSVYLNPKDIAANFATETSPEYHIGGVVDFQVKVILTRNLNAYPVYNHLTCIKFKKLRPDDVLTYMIKFSSKELKIKEKSFSNGESTWHLIHEKKTQLSCFDVKVEVDLISSPCAFASLHDDSNFTDFELLAEDGSVHVHRAVLAASSPVLRTMLEGTWKETAKGSINVSGTSLLTLQHLKDYMYLRTLPVSGLEQVLLLASLYMMPELEQKCAFKLMDSLTEQNAYVLLQFAMKYKNFTLFFAILNCVKIGTVRLDEMRDYCARGEDVTSSEETQNTN